VSTTDLAPPARALAIGAHPDDVEFGCGATFAKWAASGSELHVLVLTDGSKGSWEGEADLAALVATREAEQRAAADALGVAEVHFLRCVDGELDSDLATRARVCEVIRRVRPDVVVGHDPWKRYRLHPDHRHAGLLAVEGIVAARDPHFFPEQEPDPHRPRHLMLFEPEEVDHHEAVDGWIDAKIEALLRHRSQWRTTMGIDRDPERERARFAERLRVEASAAGRRAGLPAAEPFKRLDDL